MPRDLADVLHYFMPELEPRSGACGETPHESARPHGAGAVGRDRPASATGATEPAPLPILGVPIGEHDVVRAALTWNLAVETARLGGSATVLAPSTDADSPLWPATGMGPLGTEVCLRPAKTLEDLHAAASDLARRPRAPTRHGGIVFVRIPPAWLESGEPTPQPFRWLLLLSSARRRDLREAFALSKALMHSNPGVEIGVTIHGVRTIAEAREAFDRLHRTSEHRLGLSLFSYGLLVDDLHVYRAIAAQRPIGLAHPQAPATRALMDVARLLYEDARSRVLG